MTKLYLWGAPEHYGNYQRAVELAGGQVQFGGDSEGCAGLLLPGGGDLEPWRYGQYNTASRGLEPKRDAAELALIARFVAAKKPVLGICRGLQTLNVFFGGTLVQDIPGHSAVEQIDRMHWVYTEPSWLHRVYGGTCIVNSAHHQAVERLGAGLRAVQWAPDGTIEALLHETLPVWAVQWHPERMGKDGAAIFQWFLMRCKEG